ncbi:MAG: SDR family oxidoreductase [Leucobacter sp.]|jgi:NAD(P)-dependent dehydrogenase (short-subunit alcohol dehydrogenase family)|nr:SDR family oxidoreductase [Leucobacter sp.]
MPDPTPAYPAQNRPLEGRVIIVTGASGGLGAQFAHAISQAGGHVIGAARRRENLLKLADSIEGFTPVQCDVTEASDQDQLVAQTLEKFGRIDGLVNNAGVVKLATALKEPVSEFRRVVETNLVAPFALAQAVAKTMREQEVAGSIVNITSIAATRSTSFQAMASYAASKAGLVGLTRELAQQWARYSIRVNSIAPGPFVSDMGDEYKSGPIADLMNQRIPLGRVGQTGELDGALLYLLGDASTYVTGHNLVVDGGMTTTG